MSSLSAARSPPAAHATAAASLSEDEFRLLHKYMPEDAALMRPIPQVQLDRPELMRPEEDAVAGADVELPRTVAPTATPPQPSARRGLSLRPANFSPPAAVVLGARDRSCAPLTAGRSAAAGPTPPPSDTETETETEAPPAPTAGPGAPEDALELRVAREHVARLQRDLGERDLALQRLSAAHDAGVRRQISMQEHLNAVLQQRERGGQPADAETAQWQQTLRAENERLREQAQRSEAEAGQLTEELGVAQRTVAALQTERLQRRDTVGVVAAERLAEKETEWEQNVRHLQQIVEAQEQQLLALDEKAAQGQALSAEVGMLRKRERELSDSVLASHDTLERQSTLLEQADAQLTELKARLKEAEARAAQDSDAQVSSRYPAAADQH